MAPSFRVILRSGPNPGKVFPLEKVELFIGRDLSNDVVINDPEISRRHSRLLLSNGVYLLEDLGSTNGTSINSQRLVSHSALHHGDVITLGERITLVYEALATTGDDSVSAGDVQPDRTTQGAQGVPMPLQQAYSPAYNPPTYEPASFQPHPITPQQQTPQVSTPPMYQPEVQSPPLQYQQMPHAAQPQYQQMPPPPLTQTYDPLQPPFSGQIPINPAAEPVEFRTKTPIWSYIVIGVLLLIILVLVIDDFKLWTLFGIR
jgi:predicted component of type VI protein secretion system